MADSPMERAVRALSKHMSSDEIEAARHNADLPPLDVVRGLFHAFYKRTVGYCYHEEDYTRCRLELDAVLDMFQVAGIHLVSEGQAVIEGRVVELEADGFVDDQGNHFPWLSTSGIEAYDAHRVYRVKPERSDRHTEPTCPSCGAPIKDHDSAQRKTCHDAASGFDRGRKQHTEGKGS